MYHKLLLGSSVIIFFCILLSYTQTYNTKLLAIPLQPNVCNILSMSGGGAFGAIEIGILNKIKLPEYDLITGVSVGAINAGYLSYFNDKLLFLLGVSNMIDLYQQLKDDMIYKHNFFQIERTWSYYSTQPLRDTLTNQISNLKPINKKPTLIGSTNLDTGKIDIFNFPTYDKTNQIEIMMTSSAIPLLFEPIRYNGSLYVDGGTLSSEILNGFEEYLTDKKCSYYNITYISARPDLEEIKDIDTLETYIKRLINVVINSFDDVLISLTKTKCPTTKRGDIYHYYTLDDLKKYSALDFTHGIELIELGYNKNDYKRYDYC